ncbi:MAG: lysoplasmalogenase [Candidatus Promineifilaceae bacterium]
MILTENPSSMKTLSVGRITIVISFLIGLSAAMTIRAEFAENQTQIYLFKVLTMLMIITLAAMAKDPPLPRYKSLLIAGLIFSLVGDVLLATEGLFIAGVFAFLIAQIVYSTAFIQVGGFYRSILGALPFLLYGIIVFFYLSSGLGDMTVPVLLYVIVIMFMIWQALGQYLQTKDRRALLALIGAALFVVSDTFLAVNRFGTPIELARLYTLGTYYLAQWLFAMSAGWNHP